MNDQTSKENSRRGDDVPMLVTHDFEQPEEQPLPQGAIRIGEIACYQNSPNFIAATVLLEPNQSVLPGQFLCALHARRQASRNIVTIIQVADCVEINPNEVPELSTARSRLGLGKNYAGEGLSTRIYRLAISQTVEELELKPDSWKVLETRAPQNLLRAGDPVVLMPPELVESTLGTLSSPEDGVHVGQTFGASSAEIALKPQIFQMGALVCGNPGKGKSYFSGVLLEEACAWKIPTIVLDVNGEVVEAAKQLGGLVIQLPNPAQFGLTLNLLTSPELLSITPGVDPSTNYAQLIELAHERLKNTNKNSPISFDELTKKIQELGEELDMKRGPTISIAVSRVRKLQNDPLIGQGFDFIESVKKHQLIVLDCRYLSVRQTQLIAAAAARVLQGYGREMTRKANEEGDKLAAQWFALLFVDEAHMVVPNDESVVSTQVLYELARMGRHVRTGLILSSQSPADLDPSVLKRLQSRFVFALEKDQLKAIPGVNADLHERILEQLPKLPRGVCAVSGSSELVNHGFLLKVRERKTPVGGKTPPVFSGRTKQAIK
jgi:DNA helicase HerA-like ATPase